MKVGNKTGRVDQEQRMIIVVWFSKQMCPTIVECGNIVTRWRATKQFKVLHSTCEIAFVIDTWHSSAKLQRADVVVDKRHKRDRHRLNQFLVKITSQQFVYAVKRHDNVMIMIRCPIGVKFKMRFRCTQSLIKRHPKSKLYIRTILTF